MTTPIYSTQGISSPQEFLRHVVEKDMKEFRGAGAELRVAYHACTSLFSLRDWVLQTHDGKNWTYRSNPQPQMSVKNKRAFYRQLCAIDSNYEIISDVANASKHMKLGTSDRHTDMVAAANVHINILSSGGATAAAALGPKTTRVYAHIGSKHYDVLVGAEAVYGVWLELFKENSW
jgi:hypothetical protein